MKNSILTLSAVSAALILTACGGGGSNPPVDDIVKSSKIGGIADDDLILNGIVIAKDTSGTVLAEGRTSRTDGSYLLNVSHTGIVLVNVACEDGNSTMWNPAGTIAIENAPACGSEVTLNSLADVEAGVDQTVHISPLTEIVFQRATVQAGTSGITATEFDNSRAEIGQMFGVDPITDDPAKAGSKSAAIIGAIHALADEDSTKSVIDITNQLADELEDGSADGSSDATVSALSEEMTELNITNNLADSNGTYTPIETEVVTGIEEAKALFSELRTQAMSVVDYNNNGTPGFLDTEAQAMDVALNDVVLNVGFIGESLNMLSEGIDFMMEYNRSTVTAPFGQNRSVTIVSVDTSDSRHWTYEIKEDGIVKWGGAVTVPVSLLVEDIDVYGYTTLEAGIIGTLPLDYEPVTKTGVEDSQSFNGSIVVTKTSSGADISVNGDLSSNGTAIRLSEVTAELAYEEGHEGEPQFNYFKLNRLIVQGLVGGYTIDGSITVNGYAQNNSLKDKGGFEEVVTTDFGVSVVCPTSAVTSANLSFFYEGVTYQANNTSEFYEYFYDFYDLPIDVDYNTIQENITYTATCENSADAPYININHNWNDYDGEIANSGWLPNEVTFAGTISRTDVSMEGTLNAKWLNAVTMNLNGDTDEKPLVEIAFNGKLRMPERPEMLATLTFENNATHNTIGASYTYGSTVINLSAHFDENMDNGDVEVTTHTGLRADIKIIGGDLVTDGTSTVTKDGKLLGAFEERANVPVIKYEDGTFESLP